MGRFTKKQCIGENCLKRGAWTVCRFKGGGGREGAWQKRGGGVFEGVDTPMHTMDEIKSIFYYF